MSKRKKVAEAFDESGQPVESAPGVETEAKPRNTRTWTVQGLKPDGQTVEVVAEGMTRHQAEAMVQRSQSLLRKLYTRVRLVRAVVGAEYTL